MKFSRFRPALGSLARIACAGAATAIALPRIAGSLSAPTSCDSKPAEFPPRYLTATCFADAAAKASPALVNIAVGDRSAFQAQGSGSGFLVKFDGETVVLTNNHVVADAMRFAGRGRATVTVTLSDGVTKLRGVVQHADAISDVAIIRVESSVSLPAVALGSSASLRPGEFVLALGAPLGLTNSVSCGIVSAVSRTRSEIGIREASGARNSSEYIQTDAAINAGNSGGPLINLNGEVIGINTMKLTGLGHAVDGIAFAVPIDQVRRVISQLRRHGRVLRPYLGLKFVELNPTIASELNARARENGHRALVPSQGLYVMHVAPASPAQRAGVFVGDSITAIDSSPLRSTKQLIEGLTDKVGSHVQLQLDRQGKSADVSVLVESMQQ